MAGLVAMLAPAAPAGEPPREIVASFTQRVQPLLLNHCAAGACHGGGQSPAPRLERGPAERAPDHTVTRTNLAAFLAAVGPDRDSRTLAAMLAAGHPTKVGPRSRRAAPLSPSERLTLDRWLAQVRAAELAAQADPGVVQASAEITEPATAKPNRFRAMLDAAANPPALPPPEAPKGVIFKNDEPPAE